MHALLAAVLLLASPPEARATRKPARDPRTAGLGRSCKRNADCKHGAQRCIQQSDAKGKPIGRSFCVLPCASFESGLPRVTPGAPATPGKRKPPPPRCPVPLQCRSAGVDVPIDICVRQ
jgi:hypothetical protein